MRVVKPRVVSISYSPLRDFSDRRGIGQLLVDEAYEEEVHQERSGLLVPVTH